MHTQHASLLQHPHTHTHAPIYTDTISAGALQHWRAVEADGGGTGPSICGNLDRQCRGLLHPRMRGWWSAARIGWRVASGYGLLRRIYNIFHLRCRHGETGRSGQICPCRSVCCIVKLPEPGRCCLRDALHELPWRGCWDWQLHVYAPCVGQLVCTNPRQLHGSNHTQCRSAPDIAK